MPQSATEESKTLIMISSASNQRHVVSITINETKLGCNPQNTQQRNGINKYVFPPAGWDCFVDVDR